MFPGAEKHNFITSVNDNSQDYEEGEVSEEARELSPSPPHTINQNLPEVIITQHRPALVASTQAPRHSPSRLSPPLNDDSAEFIFQTVHDHDYNKEPRRKEKKIYKNTDNRGRQLGKPIEKDRNFFQRDKQIQKNKQKEREFEKVDRKPYPPYKQKEDQAREPTNREFVPKPMYPPPPGPYYSNPYMYAPPPMYPYPLPPYMAPSAGNPYMYGMPMPIPPMMHHPMPMGKFIPPPPNSSSASSNQGYMRQGGYPSVKESEQFRNGRQPYYPNNGYSPNQYKEYSPTENAKDYQLAEQKPEPIKEEAPKVDKRKVEIDSIKSDCKSLLKAFTEDQQQQILSILKTISKTPNSAISQSSLLKIEQILGNPADTSKRDTLFKTLTLLQLDPIVSKLKERQLQKKLVGEREQSEMKRLLDILVRDPRKIIK